MEDPADHLQAFWDAVAQDDPLWAVLSFPEKRGRRWDLRDFMKTGEREIALLFHRCAELNLPIVRGRALDFGCGVGRLTQALARRFDLAMGVDISTVMVALASRVNAYENARYVQRLSDLPFTSFDFLYSNIVLQHLPPEMSAVCIANLVRLLSPGGLLVFQLPSHRVEAHAATVRAMADAAYRASVRVVDGGEDLTAGRRVVWTIAVTNTSEREWSQPEVGSIRVGNHWFDESGEFMVVQDDGRAVLPQIVEPGARAEVALEMRAPGTPGRYRLEIDVVHEGITWFAHKGSATLQIPLEVTPAVGLEPRAALEIVEYPVPAYAVDLEPAETPAEHDRAEVTFPMYGIARDRVGELIRSHGGRIVYVDEDPRAGAEWSSYRYFVVRAG